MLPNDVSKAHVIWSAFPDFDEWKADILADEPELTEDQAYYRMVDVNNEYLEDERINLGNVR